MRLIAGRYRGRVLATPEGQGPNTLNTSLREGFASFGVPHLQEYALVLLRMEKK